MVERDSALNLGAWSDYVVTRRGVVKIGAGLLGAAAVMPLLAACGDDDDDGEAPAVDPEPEDEDADEDEPADEPDEDEAPGDGQYGGELIYALSSDPPNLDPHIHTGTAARAVKLQIYNSLTAYAPDGSIIPSLATDWEISDDGLEYMFHLEENVTFHDGSAFTGDDVAATFERLQDDTVVAHRQIEMQNVSDMTLDGDYTITLTMTAPNAPIMEYFSQPETSIMSRGFIESGADPNLEMMGTGPFTFVEHEPGVRIIVERYDNYFREELPYLDRIVFIPYPDENTRMAAVQGGDAHIGDYVPWRDMQTVDDDPNLELVASEQSAFMCVMYNLRVEPFDDPAVRRALSFAYDRDAMAEAAFFGRAEAITGGIIPKDTWAYNAHLEGTYYYDPDHARELLEEAGYPDGFSVTLMSTSQYGMHQSTAEIAQNNLQAIGIDCQLDLFDWATVIARHAESDYEFRIQGTSGDSNDPDFLTRFFHSGGNDALSQGFTDSDIDQMIEEGRTLVDQGERIALYGEIEERLMDLQPMNYLVYRQDAEAVWSNVHGYQRLGGPLGFLSAVFLHEVWIEE